MKDRSPSPKPRVCANPHCQRHLIHARGRCQACYVYLRRHGRDATPPEMGRRGGGREKCHNCRDGLVYARNRCQRCYQYWRRNGSERPSTGQKSRDGLCVNCGRRPPYRFGRCRSCYAYLNLHHKDRPEG